MHKVLPYPFAQSRVPYLRKEVEVPWFRLPVPSTWQKGALPKPSGPNSLPKQHDLRKEAVVPKREAKWLPHLGLNPSPNLPLQPHFQLLLQLATAASIPGRCGPVVWSQLSPSFSGPHYKSPFGAPVLAAPWIITGSPSDVLYVQV